MINIHPDLSAPVDDGPWTCPASAGSTWGKLPGASAASILGSEPYFEKQACAICCHPHQLCRVLLCVVCNLSHTHISVQRLSRQDSCLAQGSPYVLVHDLVSRFGASFNVSCFSARQDSLVFVGSLRIPQQQISAYTSDSPLPARAYVLTRQDRASS